MNTALQFVSLISLDLIVKGLTQNIQIYSWPTDKYVFYYLMRLKKEELSLI